MHTAQRRQRHKQCNVPRRTYASHVYAYAPRRMLTVLHCVAFCLPGPLRAARCARAVGLCDMLVRRWEESWIQLHTHGRSESHEREAKIDRTGRGENVCLFAFVF